MKDLNYILSESGSNVNRKDYPHLVWKSWYFDYIKHIFHVH